MKKYIKPETTVVLLQTETLIAESITVKSDTYATKDGGSGDYTNALGREDNAWDIWGNEDASEE